MLTFHLLIYYILPQKHTEILVPVCLFHSIVFVSVSDFFCNKF